MLECFVTPISAAAQSSPGIVCSRCGISHLGDHFKQISYIRAETPAIVYVNSRPVRHRQSLRSIAVEKP